MVEGGRIEPPPSSTSFDAADDDEDDDASVWLLFASICRITFVLRVFFCGSIFVVVVGGVVVFVGETRIISVAFELVVRVCDVILVASISLNGDQREVFGFVVWSSLR